MRDIASIRRVDGLDGADEGLNVGYAGKLANENIEFSIKFIQSPCKADFDWLISSGYATIAPGCQIPQLDAVRHQAASGVSGGWEEGDALIRRWERAWQNGLKPGA